MRIYSHVLDVMTDLIAAIAIAIIIVGLTSMAYGATVCMSKSEARAKWPKSHLYWHGGADGRCWDNRRGGNRYRNIKRDAGIMRAQAPTVDPVRVEPTTTPWKDEVKVAQSDDKEVKPNHRLKKSRSETHGKSQPSPAAAGIAPSIFYPSLRNPLSPVDRVFFDTTESTLSYRLLDIDELTAKQPQHDDEEDCCWPKLDYDGQGNVIGLAK